MKKIIRLLAGGLLAGIMAGMLYGCGGGGGGSAPAGANKASGKFVDGPAIGLGYNCGSTTGITGAGGAYTYVPGKTVKFFVGNVDLGEAPARPVITPLHLIPGANAATPEVVRMVRFLLSVGTLNPDNSITIPPAVTDAAKTVAQVDVTTLNDAQLDALVKAVKGVNATLVDAVTATNHLSGCILTEYQGAYSGGFTGVEGDPDRTWVLTINPDGTVTGYGSNKIIIEGVLQNETITGTISNGTDFTGAAAGGCMLEGKLDVTTGVLSGTWQIPNSNPLVSGTFRGR